LPVNKVVVIQMGYVLAPVLEANELALLLEKLIVLADVLTRERDARVNGVVAR
jgi:hypothetical protein